MSNIPDTGPAYGGVTDPQTLRNLYDIRFRHYFDQRGRLLATVATETLPDVVDEDGQPLVAVAAAFPCKRDKPSRAVGRAVALARLEVGFPTVQIFERDELRAAIRDGSILDWFPGGSGKKRKVTPRDWRVGFH